MKVLALCHGGEQAIDGGGGERGGEVDTAFGRGDVCSEETEEGEERANTIHRIHVYSSACARPHTRLAGSTTPSLA